MLQICMNLDAPEWNAQQVSRLCSEWGVSCLHILKMVARRPQVVRLLADCGILHPDVSELDLDLPGAAIVDFRGNYSILDVTECTAPPVVDDTVIFRPRYWAMARACRSPTVSRRFIRACNPSTR